MLTKHLLAQQGKSLDKKGNLIRDKDGKDGGKGMGGYGKSQGGWGQQGGWQQGGGMGVGQGMGPPGQMRKGNYGGNKGGDWSNWGK